MDSSLPAKMLKCIKTGKIVIQEDGTNSVEIKISEKNRYRFDKYFIKCSSKHENPDEIK